MKKGILLAVLLFALAVTGSAQIKPAVYAGGGIGLPMSPSDFTDNWKMGVNFGGGVGIEVSPMFELVGRVGYNTFALDMDEYIKLMEMIFGVGVSIDGGSFKALEIMTDVKFLIPAGEQGAPFKPYLLGGLGMVNASFSDLTVTVDDVSETLEMDVSETKFAFNVGAGFEYMASPSVGLFVDGRYLILLTEGESTSYLPVRAGVKFMLGGQ